MVTASTQHMFSPSTCFELCFRSLFNQGRSLAFPCDAQGKVDMSEMPERVRNNYLYARALMGRDFAWPVLRPVVLH